MNVEIAVADTQRQFMLPDSVVGPADVRRMIRELEEVDAYMGEAQIRGTGATDRLPRITKALQDLTELNGLNLLQPNDRARTGRVLAALLKTAPVLHVSFATEPSNAFVIKILTYVRQNVYQYMLVQIGLQPSIGAGCVVRTNSKVFDFSLRQHLLKRRDLLIKELAGLEAKPEAESKA